MLRVVMLFFFVGGIICSVWGQGMDKLAYYKGVQFYKNQAMDSAIVVWEELIETHTPQSPYYLRAITSIATAYEVLGEEAAAADWYKRVYILDIPKGLERRFAQYRHHCTIQLIELAQKQQDYRQALRYVAWAKQKYPVALQDLAKRQHAEVKIVLLEASLYEALEEVDSAIYVLNTAILTLDLSVEFSVFDNPEELSRHAPLLERSLTLIDATYQKYFYRKAWALALEDISFSRQAGIKYVEFELKGMQYSIPLYYKKLNKNEAVSTIQNSYLYQLLR